MSEAILQVWEAANTAEIASSPGLYTALQSYQLATFGRTSTETSDSTSYQSKILAIFSSDPQTAPLVELLWGIPNPNNQPVSSFFMMRKRD